MGDSPWGRLWFIYRSKPIRANICTWNVSCWSFKTPKEWWTWWFSRSICGHGLPWIWLVHPSHGTSTLFVTNLTLHGQRMHTVHISRSWICWSYSAYNMDIFRMVPVVVKHRSVIALQWRNVASDVLSQIQWIESTVLILGLGKARKSWFEIIDNVMVWESLGFYRWISWVLIHLWLQMMCYNQKHFLKRLIQTLTRSWYLIILVVDIGCQISRNMTWMWRRSDSSMRNI